MITQGKKPQLLMIAYYFPPLGGAGVQRSAKFAKYLARLGWQIEVVSVEPTAGELRDNSLTAEIDLPSIRVQRVPYREPFRNLDRWPGGWRLRGFLQDWWLFPDRAATWLGPAYVAAERVCEANPGIPIFTTAAPYTAHLIGLALKRRFGSFWAADFRDEWTQNPYLRFPTRFHANRHRQAERQVLAGADLITAVTKKITNDLHELAPQTAAVFETIPNGFDPDDLKGLNYQRQSHFTLTHIGTLNPARSSLVEPLVKVLKRLVAQGKIPAAELRLHLIGSVNPRYLGCAGLDWVVCQDYLPHREALKAMSQSDLLILAESNPAAFTGKIFEYLGLGRPILGLVHPASPAAELIQRAQAGWVVSSDDLEELEKIILTTYQGWRSGKAVIKPQATVVSVYNRELQAAHLAELIIKGNNLKRDNLETRRNSP